MGNPIVHFELPCDEPGAVAAFYRELFDWEISAEQHDYMLIRTNAAPGTVNGGIIQRQSPNHHVAVYVLVDSVEETLAKAVELGASQVMGRTEVPNMGAFGVFTDPQGNAMGVWEEGR